MKFKALTFSAIAMATGLSSLSVGQTLTFREIPAGISLFASPIAWSITDGGIYLIDIATASGPNSAFTFDGTHLKAVPAQAGDVFYALNDVGSLTGDSNTAAFYQDKKGKQTTITRSTDSIFASSLNNKNVVVGQGTPSSGNPYGFLWQNGTFTAYIFLGASSTSINGISDLGDYVGNYTDATTNQNNGFAVKSGKTSILDVLDLSGIVPNAINTSKTIVGYGFPTAKGGSTQLGFVMNSKGVAKTYDYTASAPPAMPGPKSPLLIQNFTGQTAFWGVNNHGTVVGQFIGTYQSYAAGIGIAIPIVGTP